VAAYFKNVGQTRTLIELLQDRSAIQERAGLEMQERFMRYNLELEEVLIGTPTSSNGDAHIETILTQLRARQIAEEQVETYARQEKAAIKERELREAMARAERQQAMTESELSIVIQGNEGKAAYQRSLQEAAQIRALAEADAEKEARIGIAKAIAIEEQVKAYGGPRFQVTQQVMERFAQAIEQAKVDVVPKIVVGNGGGEKGGAGSSVLETLLAMLLSDKIGEPVGGSASTVTSPAAHAMKDRIRASLEERLSSSNGKG
jgi:uncharacterized membrane protein YqiK